ncbi:MAG: aspartate aminotransferase family protein [Rubrivivax sp.]
MTDTAAHTAQIIPPIAPGPIIVEGKAATVTDDQGKVYIDLEGGPGVSTVGHCHPKVVDAIVRQAPKLIHSPCRYNSHLAMELADRISAHLGGSLNRMFFSNSGAEANDGAVKLSLKHAHKSGKRGFGILALEHAFHGRSTLPLALTGTADKKKDFAPHGTFPGVVHVDAPYCYRCPMKLDPDTCGGKCADSVERALLTKVPGEAAIMIIEPVMGVGGVLSGPKVYYQRLKQICERNRITMIFDEVFTGFARTGRMFAHDHFDVKPEVMTFAKAIGGGLPLGGFIAIDQVGGAFDPGDHFSTYGMNSQLSLVAAHAVLDVVEQEGLCDQAAQKGRTLMNGLRELQARHECIGEVRGKGLMIGVELVEDRETRVPAPKLAQKLIQEMRRRNVLVSVTGTYGCVMRITPPLVISEQQIAEVVQKFDEGLTAARAAA